VIKRIFLITAFLIYSIPAIAAGWLPLAYCPGIPNPANPPDFYINFTADVWCNNGKLQGTTGSSQLTVSRASTKYVNDSWGRWSLVNSNTLARSNLGALIEDARTNSVRNNSAQGTVPGSPGTMPTNWSGTINSLTRTVVGTGTENNIDYVDVRFSGTTVGTSGGSIPFEASTQIAASVSQNWGASVFVTLIGGSVTGIGSTFSIDIAERDAGGAALTNGGTNYTPAAGALGQSRWTTTRTLSNASTAFVIPRILISGITAGIAVDFTLRIGWPQLELGASVTSPIRTTSAAVTRAGDVVTLTSPGVFGSAYSLYAKGTPQAPVGYNNDQGLITISDGTSNNRFGFFRNSGNSNFGWVWVGNSVSAVNSSIANVTQPWAQNAVAKLAAGGTTNDLFATANVGAGASVGTATLLVNPSVVSFGSKQGGSSQFNGFLSEAGIWYSQRVPNAQLQSMTQ
jgi:hypothetical protein